MNMTKKIKIFSFIITFSLCLGIYSHQVLASGLESKGIGARSRGLGFAMIAITDEWSSVYYNPASVGMIKENIFGFEYEFFTGSMDSSHSLRNLSLDYANVNRGDFIDFIGDEPNSFNTKNIESDIHFGALGCLFKGEKFSYGIGVYGSGSGTAWEDQTVSFLSDPIKAEVSFINGAMNVPVVIAYRYSPKLSFGATIGFNWGLLTYKTIKERTGNIPYIFKTVQDTEGIGISTDLGLFWKAKENFNLGIVLKLPYTFKKTGDTRIRNSLAQINAVSDTTVYMRYPLRISLGISLELTEKDLLAAGISWLNWNKYNLKIDYDNQIPGLFDNYSDNPSDWKNSIVANLGFEHTLNDQWKVRCGLTYDQAPEPTGSKILTGGQVVDAWLFSVGAGVDLGNTILNFGYIYTYGPKVDGFIPGAQYSLNLHELFFGIVKKF